MSDVMTPTREDEIALLDAPRTFEDAEIRAWAEAYGTPNLERILILVKGLRDASQQIAQDTIQSGVVQAQAMGVVLPPANDLRFFVSVLPNQEQCMKGLAATMWADLAAEIIRDVLAKRMDALFPDLQA